MKQGGVASREINIKGSGGRGDFPVAQMGGVVGLRLGFSPCLGFMALF